MYLVIIATYAATMYLFLSGNNWGGFGIGFILVFELLVLALADAMARDFGEKIIEDTKRDHYFRGYEAGIKEGEKSRERRERRERRG